MFYQRITNCILLLVFASTSLAQEKKEKKWDVNNPEGPYKEVSFNVNEGTSMFLLMGKK
jgi:hypothetical protein